MSNNYTCSRIFVGVDPGNNGAFSIVTESGHLVKTWAMPKNGSKFDPHGIGEWFRNLNSYCTRNKLTPVFGLEKTFAYSEDYKQNFDPLRKIEGIVSMHNYGIGFGVLLGAVVYLGYKHHLLSPKTWQGEMWHGVDPRKKSKEKSLDIFKRIWPDDLSLVQLGERTNRPHDGAVDAALIAEYVRRIEK